MQCEATKRDGIRCRANALSGAKRCSFHADPNKAASLGKKGGLSRKFLPFTHLTELDPPETAEQVRKLLGHVLVETRSNQLAAKIGNACAVIAGVLLKAVEQSDIETRLRRLEDQLSPPKGRR